MLARKWKDETSETILKAIEWNTTRTGLINPVAVFEPVDLDGAITTKATLHNISYIENLELGIGDVISVYRANMVIPKVHNNLTRSNTWSCPDKCPCCGGEVEIHNENGSKTLHCTNPDCQAKLLSKLEHACSKQALNIEDLSESTLEFLVNKGWIKSINDIYTLDWHWDEWIKEPGFGEKSVLKLLENIAKSKDTTLDRFLYAQSIPLIGRSASKDIAKFCNGNIKKFCDIVNAKETEQFLTIEGFGETMLQSLNNWQQTHWNEFLRLKNGFNFPDEQEKEQGNCLEGKTFVITGSLEHFKNRDELTERIIALGGKVSGSVSAKTTALINNDINSTSGKNAKAKSLSVPVISENDFIKMIGE